MKQQPVLIQYIDDRIKKRNKNFMMVIVGPTGSGKSYATLRLAELLDPDFNIDRCCFRAKEFMGCINKLIQEGKAKAGTVVVWDEVGVEHNAREFMTISNRVINYFFQTCRHLNLIILMTLPLLSSIDSASRKLMHAIAETNSINTSRKTCSLKIKMLQTNVISGKEYLKYLRYKKNQRVYKSCRIKVNLPSKNLLEQYEKKKKEFTDYLNRTIMKELERVDDRDRIKKALSPMQERVINLLQKGNVEYTAKELGIHPNVVYLHKKYAEQKGYMLKPIYISEGKSNKVVRFEVMT